jgi:hypothetical protein
MMSKYWLYLGIILACSGIGTVAGVVLIILYVWGDIREAVDGNNVTKNNVEDEHYNVNDYSKETAEEMK